MPTPLFDGRSLRVPGARCWPCCADGCRRNANCFFSRPRGRGVWSSGPTTSRRSPPADWSDDRAAHLLERAGFGATPEEIARLAAMTPRQAVDALVDYESIASDLKPFDESGIWDPGMDPFPPSRAEAVRLAREHGEGLGEKVLPQGSQRRLQPVVDKFFYSLTANGIETQRLGLWWANRMLTTSRPLEEKLTLFWHGHFATGENKVRDYRMMLRQNEMFRAQRLGQPPRPAGRDPEGSGDARLSRQRRERQEASERELRPRAARAVHDGRGQLHRARRARGRARLYGMDQRRAGVQARSRTSTTPARRRSSAGRDRSTARTSSTSSWRSRPPADSWRRSCTDSSCAKRSPAAVKAELGRTYRDSGYQMKPLLKRIFLSRDFYSPPAFATQIKSPGAPGGVDLQEAGPRRGADDPRLRPHDGRPGPVAVRSAERRRLGRRPHLDYAVDAAAARQPAPRRALPRRQGFPSARSVDVRHRLARRPAAGARAWASRKPPRKATPSRT